MTVRTVGVEEEFLLFDAEQPRLLDIGARVVDAADRADDEAQFEKELKKAQVEHASSPATSLDELARELARQRAALVESATRRRARLVASGTCPVDDDSATTDDERYQQMERRFAAVLRSELTCAMHMHVAVDSDQQAVAVLDRIAPWLPVLAALSANSPFHRGMDTGYASYRRVLWDQWPTAGAIGSLADAAAYHRLVDTLVATGAARDRAMIYFDARLSDDYPTLEIRVCDVCIDVDDAVTIAGLARAMVETATRATDNLEVRPELLRAASWRAARFGMSGELVDLTDEGGAARLRPAWDLVDALVEQVGPALDDAGDAARVAHGLSTLKERGTGADRQRSAATDGGLSAAVSSATLHPD